MPQSKKNLTQHLHDIQAGDSPSLLHAALDASVSGIIITDNQLPDNPIIYCNNAFIKISGYEKQDIIGHNCRFLQGDDRKQAARKKIREAVDNGENVVIEIRNYRKDGELFWNELFISPIRDNEGNVTHFIGVQNDVTLRKKAQEELRYERDEIEKKVKERTKNLKLSHEYLDSIIQTVRESLLVLDPSFKVLTANEEFLRKFKVSKSETLGRPLYDLGNRQWDIQALKDLLEKILPTNNPVLDFEVEHDFPHIGTKRMLLNAHRVELEGEYKDRILLAIEDITEKRAIEQRKDDFLSVASHELKTPLTTIKGYLQLLNRFLPPELDPKATEILNKTKTQIDRLNNLISELLDVSKIQSGNLEVHRGTFDFDKMVADTVDSIQVTTFTHKIEILGSTGVSYYGDESHLAQVLSNLLANGIKYSPKGKHLVVHLSTIGNFVKLSVKDFGMGISLNDQKKIFERFYRVSNIQKRFPGMGIGLYICEQIVKQHGGSIWVDSEEGQGSTFSLTLPLNKEELDD